MEKPFEIKERKDIKYLQTSMNFNPGTLSYEPTIPMRDNPLDKKTKLKVYTLSIILIILTILMMALVFT